MRKVLTRIADVLKRMGEILRIRGYSLKTVKAYISQAKGFLEFTPYPVDQINQDLVHDYLVHMKDVKKLAGSTINQALFAIQFLFIEVIHKPWDLNQFRCHKRPRKLPVFLSADEIFRIVAKIFNPKHRMIIVTAFSAGLRLNEVTHLKCRDIDSEAMRIVVRNAKGEKDRCVMLSVKLLPELREYWYDYRPAVWLFPGRDPSQPIGHRTVQRAFKRAKEAAGIDKPATMHSLRHSFAVQLLEAGNNLKYIKEILGHSSIQTTMRYLKFAPECTTVVRSPLDQLPSLPPIRRS
ncbi:MAG: tyrosine-type recombinase/integrase [bacterium]|nr:tyrosine-type recombinase/integrase [bacterium]